MTLSWSHDTVHVLTGLWCPQLGMVWRAVAHSLMHIFMILWGNSRTSGAVQIIEDEGTLSGVIGVYAAVLQSPGACKALFPLPKHMTFFTTCIYMVPHHTQGLHHADSFRPVVPRFNQLASDLSLGVFEGSLPL